MDVNVCKETKQNNMRSSSAGAPHIIRPVNAKVLANTKTGEIFGDLVHHPGTKANPYMERIIAAAQPDITSLFEGALETITAQIAARCKWIIPIRQKMKAAIVNDLQSLLDSGVLNSVVQVDYSKQFVNDYTWPGFPSALVIPPTISTSEYEDSVTNVREYTWNILVVTTTENLAFD